MFKGWDPLSSCVIAPAPRNPHRRSDSLKHFKLFFFHSLIIKQTVIVSSLQSLTGTHQANKTLMGEVETS